MKLRLIVGILCINLLAACSPPGNGTGTNTSIAPTATQSAAGNGTVTSTLVGGSNSMVVKVSDVTLCSASAYQNEPCVAVTICQHGTTTCQTVSNILLDTGSYGLRVFSSTLSGLSLTAVNAPNANPLAECAQFGSGNAWGSVVLGDVQLGGETASNVPIQLINSSYSTHPASCTSPFTSAASAGFNGILGVGLGVNDCPSCVASTAANYYYSCSGATCTASLAPAASQVTNPVSVLTTDNNGIALVLPAIGTNGANSVTGELLLGVGTQSNNTPSASVKTYYADDQFSFTSIYNSQSYNSSNLANGSFLDSGSNFFYFPLKLTTECSGGYYCPNAVTAFTASIESSTGSVTTPINFNIANANTLVNTGNKVFNDLGQQTSGYFDWGLPFFLGRTVYVVMTGKSSSLGTGPLWGF